MKNISREYVFIIALIVHFITAFNSIGFYHAEEHYQILEFAHYKMGYL